MKFDDPMLVDRSGKATVATTDPSTLSIYISDELDDEFLTRVLIHELGHCTIFSFGLLGDIHRMVYPLYWEEAEEWVCNFIADYGMMIFSIAKDTLGNKAVEIVPQELERLVA